MASIIQAIIDCIAGLPDTVVYASEIPPADDIRMANSILQTVYSAKDRDELNLAFKDCYYMTDWTESLAKCILSGLENALKKAAPMGELMKNTLAKVTSEASQWLEKPEVYWTILALGVLVVIMPWVIEALGFWAGFGELGPIKGSIAALWMRSYRGVVPKGSLFAFFQRLGMLWKTKVTGVL